MTPTEICNGLDDDCDGEVDEDDPGGGAACDTGEFGACGEGVFVCLDGVIVCDSVVVVSQVEVCNGVDDDCDGEVDEASDGGPLTTSCYGGPPGTQGVGACAPGERVCTHGVFGGCIGQVRPQPGEICDEVDNDCDGETDEGLTDCTCSPGADPPRPCYTGPAETEGVGQCIGGTQTCFDGVWKQCEGEVLPQDELCNELDDDCDGEVDEGLALGQPCVAGLGVCAAAGLTVCGANGAVVCSATPGVATIEVCDGLDNDCDGVTDETPVGGQACSVGLGVCLRHGVTVCDPLAQDFVCNVAPGAPSVELCNELDDDCDGQVDEGFDVDGPCTVGIGACQRSGTWLCWLDGTRRCSVQPGGPGPEICDGLDNDCDGEVDDGFGLGNPCLGLGVCRVPEGVWECAPNGAAICSSMPGASDSRAVPERCNGLDDDCDGAVDEDWWGLGTACWSACGQGVFECMSDGSYTTCSTGPGGSAASPEICNGLDDDCDWGIDEGFGVGGACDGVGACGAGSIECDAAGGTRCSTDPGGSADQSTAEICGNGLDDDCDGAVDEGC